MAKTTRDVLAEYRANIEKGCEDATKALTGNKLNALRDAEKIIELNEKAYEKELLVKIYSDLMLKENPIESAIRMYSYKTIRHREKRDAESKRVIAYEVAEKERQLDLLKFCEFTQRFGARALSTMWQYSAARLNQLLCLRTALALKFNKAELDALCTSYYLHDNARRIEMGETPTSDTQVCKALQMVVDSIIFKDDGNGKNAYKCNNHDVAYLVGCYTKKSKKALTLSVAKDGFFRLLITEVCLRILENGRYGIDGYKVVKEATTPVASESKA